jgi:hypothetical protein
MTWMGEWDDYYLLLIGSFPHSLRLAPIRQCVPEDGKKSSLQIWKRWIFFFPHISILLVIGKIMNFQSPTYPKLQLVPPTAISAISSAPRWGWTAGRCTTQFPNLII